MKSTIWRIALVSALALLMCAAALGQRKERIEQDENFDSPTPILLTESDTTRALSQSARRGTGIPKQASQAYPVGSKVKLYVSDLDLMPGEGANAFRVYAEDGKGSVYRFHTLNLEQAGKNMWELTVLLTDEIGYFVPPAGDGDVLIYVTWRGLASNKARLGLGVLGGGPKDDMSTKIAPVGSTNLGATKALPVAREADRLRFQEQAAFGPTPALTSQLARTKLGNWIQSQFTLPYPDASFPYPNQPLKPINAPADCDGDQTVTPDVPVTCFRDTYTPYPIQTWNSQMMIYGQNQLRHRVAWALSQLWVTSQVDIQQSRHMVEYHKVLSNNAFGNYRTLMREMTLNPTMGEYLSMNVSTRTNPNENYAREIMQLFTIGLFMLNQDGTLQLDGSNNPIPTYSQTNVNELTRVLTGWSVCSVAASCPNIVAGAPNFVDPMLLNGGVTTQANNRHDLNAKTLLTYSGSTTTNVAACPTSGASNCTTTGGTTNAQALANISTYAYASLDQALDNLFYHPNVGPFVAKNLIQQMVTSDPTPAYVGRVAAAFNNNGAGVRGDMKAVITAVLLDREARGNNKTDPNYGKLREPVQFAANILRIFNATAASGSGQSDGVLTTRGEYTGMGQTPFRSPTVFNYYPPDFVIPGTALLGPEFALMTTGTTIGRANFVNRMVFTSPAIPGGTTDTPFGTALTFSDLQTLSAGDPSSATLMDELDRRMMHGTMSSTMRSTILTALAPTTAGDIGRVRQAVYLVATSSQYQIQR